MSAHNAAVCDRSKSPSGSQIESCIERERVVVALDGGLPSTQMAQREGSRGVDGSVLRRNGDGALEGAECRLKIPRLTGQHAR
jgi:hypothetical protein